MRLVYVSPLTTERIVPADAAWTIDILEALVAGLMASTDPVRLREVAIGRWSILHGSTMLRLRKRLAADIDAEITTGHTINAAVRLAWTA